MKSVTEMFIQENSYDALSALPKKRKGKLDLRQVIDAARLAQFPNIDGFFLIYGKGDITPLISYLKGYGKDVIEQKFSALYNAFKFGAPPHAGIAPGVDRIVMLLAQEPNIREVIVFPMDRNARDILMGAPSEVTEKQLRDVHIKLDLPKEEEKSE